MRTKYKKFLKILIYVGLFVLVGSFIPDFLKLNNLINITRQSASTALCAVGVSVVIITGNGNTDLSITGMVVLTPMICALLMLAGVPVFLSIIISLVVCTLLGVLNGFLVTNIGIPAFIATYVMGQVAAGVYTVISQGRSIGGLPQVYGAIGNSSVGIIPISTVIMVVYVAAATVLMTRTRLGKHIYALGGSELTVKYEGIDVKRLSYFAFGFSAFCTGSAGIIISTQLSAVQSTIGANSLLDAVAAAGIGGISMLGGEGKIWCAAIGALFMGCLRNILTNLGMHPYFQNLFIGVIIIAIVAVAVFNKNRRVENSKIF